MTLRIVAPAIVALALLSSSASAQAPTSGWRAEFFDSFGSIEKKFTALADATPWEQYGWRPAPGVKSVCEVFLHVAGHNYTIFACPLGAKPPANVSWSSA